MKPETMREVVQQLRASQSSALLELVEMEQAINQVRKLLTGLVAFASSLRLAPSCSAAANGNDGPARAIERLRQIAGALDEYCGGLDDWKIAVPRGDKAADR